MMQVAKPIAITSGPRWLDWLDTHSGTVQALSTLVLLLVTAWYSYLTWRIAKASSKSADAAIQTAKSAMDAQRPYLYVDVVTGGGYAEFVIGNDGSRAARNIKLELIDPSSDDLLEALKALPAMTKGLAYMAPGRHYRFMLAADGQKLFEERTEHLVLKVGLAYDGDGVPYTDNVELDLTAIQGVMFSSFSRPLEDIAYALKGIARSADHVTSDRSAAKWSPRQQLRLCPSCCVPVHAQAKKCPSCLEWIDKTGLEETPPATE